MILEALLRLAGLGQILLALLHVTFPRKFSWRADLAGVSLLNRQIFYVHTLFIAVTVAFFGILSIVAADGLAAGGAVLAVLMAGLSIFWLLRLAVQLFFFDARLWRGQPFNTFIHLLFTLVWTALATVYAWAFVAVTR